MSKRVNNRKGKLGSRWGYAKGVDGTCRTKVSAAPTYTELDRLLRAAYLHSNKKAVKLIKAYATRPRGINANLAKNAWPVLDKALNDVNFTFRNWQRG